MTPSYQNWKGFAFHMNKIERLFSCGKDNSWEQKDTIKAIWISIDTS